MAHIKIVPQARQSMHPMMIGVIDVIHQECILIGSL